MATFIIFTGRIILEENYNWKLFTYYHKGHQFRDNERGKGFTKRGKDNYI